MKAAAVSTGKIEDVVYSRVKEYEAVVSIIETLRYCSDEKHPMRMTEIYVRCAQFITNWLEKKRMQRAMHSLLQACQDSVWVEENGGRVVKVSDERNCGRYYWEKSDAVKKVERNLRERIRKDGEDVPVCLELLDKLGLNADMKNEERWRNAPTQWECLEWANYVAVKSPYTHLVLERESDLDA